MWFPPTQKFGESHLIGAAVSVFNIDIVYLIVPKAFQMLRVRKQEIS